MLWFLEARNSSLQEAGNFVCLLRSSLSFAQLNEIEDLLKVNVTKAAFLKVLLYDCVDWLWQQTFYCAQSLLLLDSLSDWSCDLFAKLWVFKILHLESITDLSCPFSRIGLFILLRSNHLFKLSWINELLWKIVTYFDHVCAKFFPNLVGLSSCWLFLSPCWRGILGLKVWLTT